MSNSPNDSTEEPAQTDPRIGQHRVATLEDGTRVVEQLTMLGLSQFKWVNGELWSKFTPNDQGRMLPFTSIPQGWVRDEFMDYFTKLLMEIKDG